MSLLDSDGEIIDKINAAKKQKKSKGTGLSRFKSLNRYKKYTEQYKEKNKPEAAPVLKEESVGTPSSEVKTSAPKVKTKQQSEPQSPSPKKQVTQKNLVEESSRNLDSKIKESPATPPVAEKIEPDEISSQDSSQSSDEHRERAFHHDVAVQPQKHEAHVEQIKEESKKVISENRIEQKLENTPTSSFLEGKIQEYKKENTKSTDRVQQEYLEEHSRSTNRVQQEYESDNNKSTEGVLPRVLPRVQNNDRTPEVRSLVGQNKKLLNIFFEDCKRQGSTTTGKFTREVLSQLLEVKPSTVKTLIYRLSLGGYIDRLPGRKGRGGWIQVAIPRHIYDQLMILESETTSGVISGYFDTKRSTQGSTTKSTNPSSSSSSLKNEFTTSTRELPEDWKNVNIPAELQAIGVSQSHIRQIFSDGLLTSDEVQDSFDSFSYDLKHNKVHASYGPLRLLMGVLRKRKSPYISEAMLSAEKQELESYMNKIKEAEEVKKRHAEMALIKKFDSWWSSLGQERKNQIVPPTQFVEEGSDMQEKIARGHFLENPRMIED